MEKNIGADLVSMALLGKEAKTVVVGGKPYFIKPPTIKKIAGAGYALGDFTLGDGSFADVVKAMKDITGAAKALSWFVAGDESLTETFMDAPPHDVIEAVCDAVNMLDIEDFRKLSGLSKSVRRLIANPK